MLPDERDLDRDARVPRARRIEPDRPGADDLRRRPGSLRRWSACSSEDGRIRFKATTRGDGEVLWDTGIPPQLRAWYAPNVVHGDLASRERAHSRDTGSAPARHDLAALARRAGQPRSGARVRRRARSPRSVCLTSVRSRPRRSARRRYARASAHAGRRPSTSGWSTATCASPTTRCSSATTRAIASSAPSRTSIDDLDGRLRGRHRLGLYPGDIGTLRGRAEAQARRRGRVQRRHRRRPWAWSASWGWASWSIP